MIRPLTPRSVVARATLLAVTSVLGAAVLVSATPQAATAWNQGAAEGTLWQLLNGTRANNGLPPLQSHGTLVGLARWRSSDMIERNYFSHDIPGTGCQVYCYYDSNGLDYVVAGENIAWNSGHPDDYSPVAAHEGFMGSPGHRANILGSSWTHGGVGAAAADNVNFLGQVRNPRLYTQLFMQAASAPPPPPPPPPSSGTTAPPPPPPSSGTTAPASGGAAQPAAAPAATAAPAAASTGGGRGPKTRSYAVDAPQRPTPSAALDGAELLVGAPSAPSTAAVRALATSDAREISPDGATLAAGEYRVAAAPAAEQGVLETFIASLIGFLLG